MTHGQNFRYILFVKKELLLYEGIGHEFKNSLYAYDFIPSKFVTLIGKSKP